MVLGVDLSTKAIDLVALDEDNPSVCEHRRVELSDEDKQWWDSSRYMLGFLDNSGARRWMHDHRIFLVGVERPYGPSRLSIASLHTILGAFIASLPRGIKAFEVSPADMRRELGLPGNCAKQYVYNQVVDRLLAAGQEETLRDWPLDAYDAWAAGHAALRINERGTPMEEAA
jgi:hypothetical protein